MENKLSEKSKSYPMYTNAYVQLEAHAKAAKENPDATTEAKRWAAEDVEAIKHISESEKEIAEDAIKRSSSSNKSYAIEFERLLAESQKVDEVTNNPTPEQLEAHNADADEVNSIERELKRQQQHLEDAQRTWAMHSQKSQASYTAEAENEVQSDEVFHTAENDTKPVIPPEIDKQFLKVGNKYHYPKNPDRVAFEDRGNKLETKANSEFVAASMVRIAEARGWDEIKVTGSESFKREVWLAAAERGMKVKGYIPSEVDKAVLDKRMDRANSIESSKEVLKEAAKNPSHNPEASRADQFRADPATAAKKHPELTAAAAAVTAIDKKIEADNLTPEQRQTIMRRVRENAARSIEQGKAINISIKETKVEQVQQAEKELER